MKAETVVKALPYLEKFDKRLDKYLKERKRPLGKFRPDNYFNNTKLEFLNVKAEHGYAIIKEIKKRKVDKKTIRKLADFLWKKNVFEKKSIAIGCYILSDLNFMEFGKIVKDIDNWAHCDYFCTKLSGPFFHENPKYLEKLKKFAYSKNPWERRFATVSLITTLKDPDVKHDTALKILSILVPDEAQREVLAASDWMIREFVKKNYKKGFDYMKQWAKYVQKTGDKNARWVLVRARHKLNEKDKKYIEELIGMKK